MSRTARRALAWLALAALVAGVTLASRRLPGAGGPAAELHYLLGQPQLHARHFHRAALILRTARERRPEWRAELFRDLLGDRDPRVVNRALLLLSDVLRGREPDGAALDAVFTDWFSAASPAARIEHLPHTLVCAAAVTAGETSLAAPLIAVTPLLDDWASPVDHDTRRWLLAATLLRDAQGRELAGMLLFRNAAETLSTWYRLQVLDGLAGLKNPDPLAPDARVAAIPPEAQAGQLRIDLEEVAEMLDDPLPEVRWAAGRIFTVAGDPRGLPGLREWLRVEPRVPPAAAAMLDDLFGPEWRHTDARGAATRDAGPGAGGR